jgi:hypothetical protein
MESYQQLFLKNPSINPKTGEKIEIGSKTYLKLVKKYGIPKIKSPKTGYKISVGKGEYNKLLKQGYTDDSLLTCIALNNQKIKSPISHKSISVHGKTYNQLNNMGYFKHLTGNKDTDTVLLLQLEMEDLNNMMINKETIKILNSESFWCQWLHKHDIDAHKNCQYIAKHIDFNLTEIENYMNAVEKGYLPIVKYLHNKALCTSLTIDYTNYIIETYDLQMTYNPLLVAVMHNHKDIVQYLLTFENNDNVIYNCLYQAIEKHYNDMAILLLPFIDSEEDINELFKLCIEYNNVEMMKILLDRVDPSQGISTAIYYNNLDIFNYLLPISTISIDDLLQALAYKNYDMLELLLPKSPLSNEFKKDMAYFIKKKRFNNLENIMKPYLNDLYYEQKYRGPNK